MIRDIALSQPQDCQRPRTRRPLFERVMQLASLARQRRQIARLDAHALFDLGLTRAEVERESRRSVWDVPQTWTD